MALGGKYIEDFYKILYIPNTNLLEPSENSMTLGKKCMELHPGKIPIIARYKDFNIENSKFLIPNHITVGYLLVLIRGKIMINHDEFLSILINDKLIDTTEYVSTLFNKYKNKDDGCLHITVFKESISKN